MPLNEDALRKVYFFTVIKGSELDSNVLSDGTFRGCGIEQGFQAFKAAYSPEVLQAMGVAVVPVKPTEDMVIAFAEGWFCQKQAIDDVKMDEAYKAMIAASPYAIKEQS